jgi:hypothetical protein
MAVLPFSENKGKARCGYGSSEPAAFGEICTILRFLRLSDVGLSCDCQRARSISFLDEKYFSTKSRCFALASSE